MRKIDVALRIWRKVFHDVISSLVIPWFKLYEMNRILCTLIRNESHAVFSVGWNEWTFVLCFVAFGMCACFLRWNFP